MTVCSWNICGDMNSRDAARLHEVMLILCSCGVVEQKTRPMHCWRMAHSTEFICRTRMDFASTPRKSGKITRILLLFHFNLNFMESSG
jgi:hypothetical protein